MTAEKVRVYRFKGWSQEHGTHVRPNVDVYRTLESIEQHELEPIMSEWLDVDSAQVSDGAYHPPKAPTLPPETDAAISFLRNLPDKSERE